MPETESWVSRGTSPAVEAGDCLGPISERRRYPIGAVNGAPETSVNAGRLLEVIQPMECGGMPDLMKKRVIENQDSSGVPCHD